MEEYSTLSRSLTNEISKTDKKAHGIYFTPPSCVNHNLKLLERYVLEGGGGGGEKKDINILEPSCGSGEYITALHKLFPNANITAIDSIAPAAPSKCPVIDLVELILIFLA